MRYAHWLPCLLLAACATIPSPAERTGLADALAARRGWQALDLAAAPFVLRAWLPADPAPAAELTVYIEGDGLAWLNGAQASPDPTPVNPLALRLALAQPDGAAAYLARPCQYARAAATACAQRYWTGQRFAPEVIAASGQALDALKQRFGASRLTLVGYSGGAAVAALLAAGRSDVARLVTVAGNLDHRAWTAYHRVLPLEGSLNPADRVAALAGVPQWHLVGADDSNITPQLVRDFAARFTRGRQPQVWVEPGFGHQCCWAEQWGTIWKRLEKN